MLTRLYVNNYRCLLNFDLKIEPLCLLLGPNGSGKSTVFTVLAKIRDFILGRGTSLELFPPETLTRWTQFSDQTFELGVKLSEGEYTYRLKLSHVPKEALNKVIEESVTLDGKPLFTADDQKIQLFNDRYTAGPQLLPDWHTSGISRIHERHDNKKLILFRKFVEVLLAIAPNPPLVSSIAKEKHPVIIPHPDCSDFADWLKHITATEGLARQQAELSLSQDILPNFRVFQSTPFGDADVLECVFTDSKRQKLKYRLDELSSGQIALIILEVASAVLDERKGVLILDEPGNFLGLSEIRPLLSRLQDAAMEKRYQVIVTAHHPIAIDMLAAGHGYWLSRDPNGPTRTQKIKLKQGFDKDEAGIRVSDLIARGWLSGLGVTEQSEQLD